MLPVGCVHLVPQTKVVWRPFPLTTYVTIRNKGSMARELPWLTFPTPLMEASDK